MVHRLRDRLQFAIPRVARITGVERWLDVAVDASRSCSTRGDAEWHHTANLGVLARGAGSDAARAGVLLEEGLPVELRGLHARQIGPAYPDGLTGREVGVLKLIAGGMTNREIAYELSISPRTAATHIRHIFEKTGLTNRVSATTYAIEKGPVE